MAVSTLVFSDVLLNEARTPIIILGSPQNAQATNLDLPNSTYSRLEQEQLIILNQAQHHMLAADGNLNAKAAFELPRLLCCFMLAGFGLLLICRRTQRLLVIMLKIPATSWDVTLSLTQETVT